MSTSTTVDRSTARENPGIANAAATTAPSGRLPALDGLRGLAAVIVVVYHLSLVARPFLDTKTPGDARWWLTETPLKIFTAGTEAVLVFFVLSGVVVALPALRPGFSWRRFFGGRFLRLYLPVWASLVFATVLIASLPRSASQATPGSWLLEGNARSTPASLLLSEASLFRASYDVNNVLWSLRWEIIFSLALPLLVLLAIVLRRWWLPAAIVAAALSIAGRVVGIDALVYMPVFFLGTLLATQLQQVLAWSARRGRLFWCGLTVASFALILASWLARPIAPAGTIDSSILWGLSSIGAIGLILLALGSPLAKRILSSRTPQWLGKISFSLYLVHVPIIATVAFLLGDSRWWLVGLISVPLSLAVALGFYVAVEKPSHRLAKAAGNLFAGKRGRVPAPTAG